MAKSISDKIAGILNAAPVSFDPEDDIHEETTARVVERVDDFNSDGEVSSSRFRTQNVELLEDLDLRYHGKKGNRRKLMNADEWSSEDEDSLPEISNTKIESNDEFDQDVQEEENEDEGSGDDKEDVSYDDESEIAESYDDEDGHELVNDNFKHLDDTDISSQVKKGMCVRQQLTMWESLLEIRIQLQKYLLTANKLPQTDVYNDIKEKCGLEFTTKVSESKHCVSNLLDKLLYLQLLLLRKYPETKNVLLTEGQVTAIKSESDEEISSDSDEQTKINENEDELVPRKKLKLKDFGTEIDKRYNLYKTYQNDVIRKWDDKTRIINSKSGNVVHSVSNQIEHILSDKEMLIKRTQLKRTNFDIVGHPEIELQSADEHNENIFDDTDFYHQLLRELIEHKSADITDPVQLGRQWIQLQNLRSKMKRNIDTRATKGRKIRYVAHTKLVNFMAPIEESTWQEEAKTELYNSLFGKNQPVHKI